MKQKLLILLLIVLASGCRSKKTAMENFNQKEDNSEVRIERVTDTVYKDRVIERVKPVFSEVIIEKPCDSLGNLNPIFANIGSGTNKSTISTLDGQLVIQQHLDSTSSVLESQYQARYERDSIDLRRELVTEDIKIKEVVRYIYPWWFYPLIGVAILLIVLQVAKRFNWISGVRTMIARIIGSS